MKDTQGIPRINLVEKFEPNTIFPACIVIFTLIHVIYILYATNVWTGLTAIASGLATLL